ncbi:MAG: type II toxin-antitoxin system HicA family toxin [Deltaproteobacteria bacterium]|nr:MAG: type II toxin-antitoxin system HicA family toxin [Deltaproteobacteria bacterium]
MSPRLPRITAKDLIRFLKQNGFENFASKGSHQHFINPLNQRKVTVPVHSGKIIGPGLLKAILNQAGLTWDF